MTIDRGISILLSFLLYPSATSLCIASHGCGMVSKMHARNILQSTFSRSTNIFHAPALKLSTSNIQPIHPEIGEKEPRIEASPKIEPSAPSYLNIAPTDQEIEALYTFLRNKKNVLCITGAGISTSSGVPDYRGPLGSYKLGNTNFKSQSSAAEKKTLKY